ncbi:alpha-1B adrenergic receptor isoform X2 [Lingula anatina]|uniref:Alpha-1B adrenergic receptor isoform X2 n=1 Tax=Lingula anatina TaxID=7574 RepID=A0A1S3J5S1_LINAN|nr:alpha-1B adrenergic receptor isoform X2 [Lingula anatina]|eukprot:XP_013405596.1 alpha-1B adrenergic receptor isoform X2 [Lingula anatina]
MELTTLDHFTLPLTSPNRTLNVTFHSDLDGPHGDHWDLPIKVIFATFLSIFMLCAIVGNLMVLSVIGRHKGMRTRTNMFLGSLATADLCVAILDMPFSLATIIRGTWIFEDEFCVFNGFTMAFFLVTSIHNLMYISVHKYVTITRPFSRVLTYRKILLMIGGAWFWGFLTAMLTVTGLNHVVYKNATTQCGPDFPHTTQQYAHTIFTTSTCWLVPFVVMIFCYRRMFVEIKGYTLRLQAHTNQERDSVLAQQKRITVTLFIVLVVFFICWFPYIVYSTYASIIEDKTSLPHWANPLAYLFGYMNSACNPIIYALRSPSFREGFKEIICRGQGYVTEEMLGCCSDADVESFADSLRTEESSANTSALRRLSLMVATSMRERFGIAANDQPQKKRVSSSSSLGGLGTRAAPIYQKRGSAIYKNNKVIKVLVDAGSGRSSPVFDQNYCQKQKIQSTQRDISAAIENNRNNLTVANGNSCHSNQGSDTELDYQSGPRDRIVRFFVTPDDNVTDFDTEIPFVSENGDKYKADSCHSIDSIELQVTDEKGKVHDMGLAFTDFSDVQMSEPKDTGPGQRVTQKSSSGKQQQLTLTSPSNGESSSDRKFPVIAAHGGTSSTSSKGRRPKGHHSHRPRSNTYDALQSSPRSDTIQQLVPRVRQIAKSETMLAETSQEKQSYHSAALERRKRYPKWRLPSVEHLDYRLPKKHAHSDTRLHQKGLYVKQKLENVEPKKAIHSSHDFIEIFV